MRRIRRLVAVNLLLILVAPAAPVVLAQAGAPPDEEKLRQTLRAYQAAWNKHDVNAWSEFLTDDVWFTQSRGKQKGRDNAVDLFKSNFKESDLSLEIVKIRMMPDGSATVQMKEVVSHLPKTDGKYKAVFESDPVISRWKNVGGDWKMFFYTSHKGWALDLLKKDGLS